MHLAGLQDTIAFRSDSRPTDGWIDWNWCGHAIATRRQRVNAASFRADESHVEYNGRLQRSIVIIFPAHIRPVLKRNLYGMGGCRGLESV